MYQQLSRTLLFAGIVFLLLGGLAYAQLFAPKVDYPARVQPYSVTSADYDMDGFNDIAVANVSSYDISILINNGSSGAGTFKPEVHYPSGGDNPYKIFSADFDNDDYYDLVVANYYGENVAVLFNNEDGTFATAVVYSLSDDPAAVCAADVNNDGWNDIVAGVSGDADDVAILLNNGDGTFGTPSYYDAYNDIYSVCTADFDQDGYLDVASANFLGGSSNDVSVFINDGDGTFAAAVNYIAGSYSQSIYSSDLDGDDYPDLAVANHSSDDVSILINDGDGTFAAPVNYSVGEEPSCIFSADLDLDGDNDLAVANYMTDNVSVLLNNNNGTFGTAIDFPVGSNPMSVFAANLDKDDDFDLAVANDQSLDVSVLLNMTDILNYAAPQPWQIVGPSFGIIADFNIVELDAATINTNSFVAHGSMTGKNPGTVSYMYIAEPAGGISIAYNHQYDRAFAIGERVTVTLTDDIQLATPTRGGFGLPYVWQYMIEAQAGTGEFDGPVYYGLANHAMDICTADFDSDADMDIAVGIYPELSGGIFLNDGLGNFTQSGGYDEGVGICQSAADLNNDGYPDLTITNGYDDFMSIMLNKALGDGTFYSPVSIPAANVFHIGVSDLDGDADNDIVTLNGSDKKLIIYSNDGIGGFAVTDEQDTYIRQSSPVIADYDMDGDLDIATSNSFGVSIFYNNGNAVFSQRLDFTDGFVSGGYLLTGDFNGDGYPDLIKVGNNEAITVFLGNGTAVEDAIIYPVTDLSDYGRGTTADFDADGDLDLVLTMKDGLIFSILILKNNGDAVFEPQTGYETTDNGYTVAADYDGDGDVDIATNSDMQFAVFFNSPPWICGDVNDDGDINILDIVYLINYKYKGGPAPVHMNAGDVNSDFDINILDIVPVSYTHLRAHET